MRKLICAGFISVTILSCRGQSPKITNTDTTPVHSEFNKNSNGLIYSDQDINALKFVIDSLNLKFKTCDLNKDYFSYPQTRLYSLHFESKNNNLKELKIELGSNPDFYTIINKYKSFLKKVDSSKILIQSPHKGDNGRLIYLSGNAFSGFNTDYSITAILPNQKWIYDYEEKGKDNTAYTIDCSFIPGNFSQVIIPSQYARLIQYIDCMIDTSASIFLGKQDLNPFERKTSAKADTYYKDINDYLNKKLDLKKKKDDYNFDYLNADKIKYAITNLSDDQFLSEKIKLLTAIYLENETGSDETEELIAAFISKEKALEIKRKRRVFGQCSQDNSPRVHAKNIAILAAETHSWDIFLQAHLNIMNDRFERITDGSYAWGKRQTYIKELEALDINVTDMMLGLCLRSFNTSDNHYNGTVWRIGKALSESKDRLLFEEKAKKIMQDDKLDEFNRSLIFLLYHTYLNHLTDKDERKIKVTALKKSVDNYPAFIQSGINEIETNLTD